MKVPVRFDEYYLVERIAVGGMAEVFKGVTYSEEGFERLMAVKRVLPHIAEDQDFIEMFVDEAKLVSQLHHPNIPQVYHLGRCEDQYFISMEFISGQDVRSIFDRGRSQGLTLDLGICAHIVMEVCEALDYAHRKTNAHQEPLHLIHRDVSPQNVIVSYDGTIKLIDFGIAKAAGKINQTQAGILKGKFSYMSPEQARGYTIDARSDLFGLGAVLYELVTLERCFLGQTDFSTIERVRNTEYRLPRKIRREIPAQLEKIIRKSLAKDPNERFQSAADFQEALRVFVRTHQLQRSREQMSSYMSSIFGEEIKGESQRMHDFRHYAAENIPQAQRHNDSRRFNPSQAQSIVEQHRPRFALANEIKLSLDPHSVAAVANPQSNEQYKVTDPYLEQVRSPSNRFPSSSRIILLFLLAILTGSLIAAVSWMQQPLISGIIFEDPQGLHPKYMVTGPSGIFEGVAPSLIELDQAGDYTLQLSLSTQEKISRTITVQTGQILKISPFGETQTTTSLINLSSTPTQAQVLLRDKMIGQTPLKLKVGAKTANITLRSFGYQDRIISLTPTLDQSHGQHVTLIPKSIETNIYTSVEGATIAVETSLNSGRWRTQGINHVKMTLDNSIEHRLKISAEGYQDKILQITPSDKRIINHWVALNPKDKKRSSTRLFAAKFVTSNTQATSTKSSVKSDPPPSKGIIEEAVKSVKPIRNKKVRRTKTRRVKRTRPKKRKAAISTQKTLSRPSKNKSKASDRQPGFLKLIAIPPAEAFIDGKSMGWTPLINIKLSEGTHRIKLRYQSGEEKVLSQTISAGRVSLRRVKK